MSKAVTYRRIKKRESVLNTMLLRCDFEIKKAQQNAKENSPYWSWGYMPTIRAIKRAYEIKVCCKNYKRIINAILKANNYE